MANYEILQVIEDTNFIQTLSRSYPNINRLLMYKKQATLEKLNAFGALKFQKFEHPISVSNCGSDNLLTWSEYKGRIITYLLTLDADSKLERGREEVAKEIFDKHFERFPKWPSRGCVQRDYIAINKNNIYDYQTYTIGYVFCGALTVEDETNSSGMYKTNVNGGKNQTQFKIINMNNELVQ
jgi:hypothetical protein